MTCYTAGVLRGAITGRLLAPDGNLWVTRIEKEQPVSLLRDGVETTLTIPRLSEARSPALDAAGNLWVAGGVNGGVARYDGASWLHFGVAEGLPAADVFMLQTAEGALWALTWEGPARFDPAGQRWQAFPGVQKAFRLLDPGDGDLWFVDGAKLLRTSASDPGTVLQQTGAPTPQPINVVDALLLHGEEGVEIWLAGNMGGQGVLARYTPQTDVWTSYTYESTKGALPVADLRRLALLPDGSLFVGAHSGGFRVIPGPPGDPLQGTWITYPDFERQTDPSAVQPTPDPVLISQLVLVNDAAGYDRLCKVW
jgi:ligand-binding sensor domain-containing protein